MVRRWRNSPAVAAGAITEHTVTEQEHETWLGRVLRSDDCRYWVICADGRPAGLAYVYDIERARRRCTWGFYNAEVELRGRGVVKRALAMVLEHVFGELGLDVVAADVLEGNEASLAVHRTLGFTVQERRAGAVARGGRRLDLLRLELRAADWRPRRPQRVVAVVQARMSSRRLPGKVLARLGEHTVLELVLRRLGRAREVDGILVATSSDPSDDPIESEAQRLSVPVLRGSLTDVLGRYVQASSSVNADAIVRITADCPLTDPAVVDRVVRAWRDGDADYVTNTLEPRSYPDGLDVEVISADALRRAGELAHAAEDREHVTPYIRGHPEDFRVLGVHLDPPHGDVRITLDTRNDLELLVRLIGVVGPDAAMEDVLEALGRR